MSSSIYNITYFKQELQKQVKTSKKHVFSENSVELKGFSIDPQQDYMSIKIEEKSYDTYDKVTYSIKSKKIPVFASCVANKTLLGQKNDFFSNCGFKVDDKYKETFCAALASNLEIQDLCLLFMALNPIQGKEEYIAATNSFEKIAEISIDNITVLPIFSQALYTYWNIPVIVQDGKVYKTPIYGTVSNLNVIVSKNDQQFRIFSIFEQAEQPSFKLDYRFITDTLTTFTSRSLLKIQPSMIELSTCEYEALENFKIDRKDSYKVNKEQWGPVVAYPYDSPTSVFKDVFDFKTQTIKHTGMSITNGVSITTYAGPDVVIVWTEEETTFYDVPMKDLNLWVKAMLSLLKVVSEMNSLVRALKFYLSKYAWFSKAYLIAKAALDGFQDLLKSTKDAIFNFDFKLIKESLKKTYTNIKNIIKTTDVKAGLVITMLRPASAATDLEAISILAKNHPYISTMILIIALAIILSVLVPLLSLIKNSLMTCSWCMKRRRRTRIKSFEKKYDVEVLEDKTDGTIMDGKWIYTMKQGRDVIVNKQMVNRPLPKNVASGMLFPWVFICLIGLVNAVTYNQPIGDTAVYATHNGTCTVSILTSYADYTCYHYAELYKSVPKTNIKRGCQGGTEDICPSGHCKDPYSVTGLKVSSCREYGVPIRECFVQKKCEYISCEDQYYSIYSAEKCVRKNIVIELLVNNKQETIIDNITSGFVYFNGKRIGYNINTDSGIQNRYIAINGLLFTENTAEILLVQYPKVKFNNSNIVYNDVTTISGSSCQSTVPSIIDYSHYKNFKVDIVGSITWELDDTQDVVNEIQYPVCNINKCYMNVTDNINVFLYCVLENNICYANIYVDTLFYKGFNMATNFLYQTIYYDSINITICSENCVVFRNEKEHLNQTTYITTQELTYVDKFTALDWILFILYVFLILILICLTFYCIYNCCCRTKNIKISGDCNTMVPKIEIKDCGDYFLINPNTHRGCGEFCIAFYTFFKNRVPIFVDLKESFKDFTQVCTAYGVYYNTDIEKIKSFGIWVEEKNKDQYHAQIYITKALAGSVINKYKTTPIEKLSECWYETIKLPISLYLLCPMLSPNMIKNQFSRITSAASITVHLVPFDYRFLTPWLGYDFSSENYKKIIGNLEYYSSLDISQISTLFGFPNYKDVVNQDIPWKTVKSLLGLNNFRDEKFFIASKMYTPSQLGVDLPITFEKAIKACSKVRELNDYFLIPSLKETIDICLNDFKCFRSLKINDFFSPIVFSVTNVEKELAKTTFCPALSAANVRINVFKTLPQISLKLNPDLMNWGKENSETCWAGPFVSFVDNKPKTINQIRNFYLRMGINPFVLNNQSQQFEGPTKFLNSIFIQQDLDHVCMSILYETKFGKVLTEEGSSIVLLSIKPTIYNVTANVPKVTISTMNYNDKDSNIMKNLCSNAKIQNFDSGICCNENGTPYFYDSKTNLLGTINVHGEVLYNFSLEISKNDESQYPTITEQSTAKIKPIRYNHLKKNKVQLGNSFATNKILTMSTISGSGDTSENDKIEESPIQSTHDNHSIQDVSTTQLSEDSKQGEKQSNKQILLQAAKELQILNHQEQLEKDLKTEILKDTVSIIDLFAKIEVKQFAKNYKELLNFYQENYAIPNNTSVILIVMLYRYLHMDETEKIEVFKDVSSLDHTFQDSDVILELSLKEYVVQYANIDFKTETIKVLDVVDNYVIIENFFETCQTSDHRWSVENEPDNEINKLKKYIDLNPNPWIFNTVGKTSNFSGINSFEPITHDYIKEKKPDYSFGKMANSCYAFAVHNFIKYINPYFKEKIKPNGFFDYKFLDGTQKIIQDYWNFLNLSISYESEDISVLADGLGYITRDTIAAILRPNTIVNRFHESQGGHFIFVWREQKQWYYCDQFWDTADHSDVKIYKKKFNWSEGAAIFATVNLKIYQRGKDDDDVWLDSVNIEKNYVNNPMTSVSQFFLNEMFKPHIKSTENLLLRQLNDMSTMSYEYKELINWKLFNILDFEIKMTQVIPVSFAFQDQMTKERFIFFKEHVNSKLYDFAKKHVDEILDSVRNAITKYGINAHISKDAYDYLKQIFDTPLNLKLQRSCYYTISGRDPKKLDPDDQDIIPETMDKVQTSQDDDTFDNEESDTIRRYVNIPNYDPNRIVKHSTEGDSYVLPILSDNAMLESTKGYLQARRCKIKEVITDTQGHWNIHAINMYHKYRVVKDIVQYINNKKWKGRIVDINDSGSDFKYLERLPNVIFEKYSHGTKDYHQGAPNISSYIPRNTDIVIFCDCNYYRRYYDLFNTIKVERKYIIATHFEDYPGKFSEFEIGDTYDKDNKQDIHIYGEGEAWVTTRQRMDAILQNVRSHELFTWGPMTMFWGIYHPGYNMSPPRYLPNHIAMVLSPSSTIKTDTSKYASELNRSKMTASESSYFEMLLAKMNLKARSQNLKMAGSVCLTGFLGYLSKKFVDPSLLAIVQSNLVSKTYETRLSKILTRISELNWNLKGKYIGVIVEMLRILTTPTEMDIEIATQITRTSRSHALQVNGMYLKDKIGGRRVARNTVVTADLISRYSFKYEFKNLLMFYSLDPVIISGLTDMILSLAAGVYGLKKTNQLNFPSLVKLLKNLKDMKYYGSEMSLRSKIKDFKNFKIDEQLFMKFFNENSSESDEVEIMNHEIEEEEVIVNDTNINPRVKLNLVQQVVSKAMSSFNQPTEYQALKTVAKGSLFEGTFVEGAIYFKKLKYIYQSSLSFINRGKTYNMLRHCNSIINYLKNNGFKEEDVTKIITYEKESSTITLLTPFCSKGSWFYLFPTIQFLQTNVQFRYNDYLTWGKIYNLVASFSDKLMLSHGIFINDYVTIQYEPINLDYIETHKKLFDSVCYKYHVPTSSPNDVAHAYQTRFRSYISPDPLVIKDFDNFMTTKIKSMSSDIMNEIENQAITVQDYINNLKSDKKLEAQATWNSIVKNPDLRIDTLLHLIPKFNEQVLADQDKVPRTIMAPSSTKKLLVGYYSYIIESAMIKIVPGFMIGKTGLQMLSEFQQYMNQDYQCYSIDGKSFDGHQHVELIRAVDNKFIEMIKYLDVPDWFKNNVDILANEHHRCYVTNRPMLKLNSNKRSQKIYNFIGKTPSGHAFHTTVMNTFRSLSYMEYTAFKAGVSIKAYAAGDDTIVFIRKSEIDKFKQEISNNFLNYKDITNKKIRSDFCHGLGQVLKEFVELPTPIFCSMVFNYNFVTKNFDNAIKRNLTWSSEPTSLILFARYLAIVSWHLCPEIEEAFSNYFGISQDEKINIPKDVATRLVQELHYTPISQGTQSYDISILPQNDLELIHFISNFTVVRRDEFMHNNRHDYLLYELYDSIMYLDMPTKSDFQRYQRDAWRKQQYYDSTHYWFN